MSAYKIKKDKLVNLEYSLKRELFRANKNGTYSSTTIVGCNTRKYHGLLVWPSSEDDYHVLLSGINETVTQHGKASRMGISKYPEGIYDPHGHRYLREMKYEPIPTKIYRVGGVILKKQRVLLLHEDRVLTKYTIVDAHSPTKLKIMPLLAFRNVHSLSKINMDAETAVQNTDHGVRYRMYQNYPYLYMQTNLKSKFVHAPDWNYNNEYEAEQERGYEYSEDLFSPGYFELDVKKGSEVVFSVGLKKANSRGLKQQFDKEAKLRKAPQTFKEHLEDAAQQFVIDIKGKKTLKTGYHWCTNKLGETLIALPGLFLPKKDFKSFEELTDSALSRFKQQKQTKQADVPLLFFYALQHYNEASDQKEHIWAKYGNFLKSLIKKFIAGYAGTVLHENGLLYSPKSNEIPISHINEITHGEPVVKRVGFLNEINALWYNALLFALELSRENNDTETEKLIGNLPDKIEHFYPDLFINEDGKNLYDYVSDSSQNNEIRPNQVFAASLCYSPLKEEAKQRILENIKKNLLTDRGLRSLSPKSSSYKGKHQGNEHERKRAKHNGSVHPWLLGAFCEAWLKLHGKSGLHFVQTLYNNFSEEVYRGGIGTISEVYDGDPPFEPQGAISYAPGVAELLRIEAMIKQTEQSK
ncbi:MAG: glycogen debranching enzyme N-terminal domain-containing protein [Bacteroidota bacterium]|nr:glycogen debranching enzyme N-terminal domain-containing protein [Bacteroidota bacterium]